MITSTRTTDVKTFLRCPREWYYSRVTKIPQKDKRAFADGTLAHRIVEMWLRNGDEPEDLLGKIFVRNLSDHGFEAGCAADAKRGMLCEWAWALKVCDINYTGKADLIDLSLDVEMADVRLVDHKTTANIAAYAETPAELAADLQLNVYVHAILTLLAPNADRVVVAHNYAEKGKIPVGRWVEAMVTRASSELAWASTVIPAVERMKRTSECPSVEDVDAADDAEACKAFGGCPFRSRCSAFATRKPKESVMTMFAEIFRSKVDVPAEQVPAEQQGAGASSVAPAFDLYIGCEPVQGIVRERVLTLDEWSAPHRERVARDAGVAHYCMIDFAKGPPLVAAWLRWDVAALDGRALVVHGYGDLQHLVVEMLAPLARNVIRRVG